jgi:hypothetical protein
MFLLNFFIYLGGETDSPSWIVFQPNIVIDGRLGVMWTVRVHLPPLVAVFTPPPKAVDFLLRRNRADSKTLLTELFLNVINSPDNGQLAALSVMFDKINAIVLAAVWAVLSFGMLLILYGLLAATFKKEAGRF